MRRLTVECSKGHREDITIGIDDPISKCSQLLRGRLGTEDELNPVRRCRRQREIVWDTGSAGFRVKGLTKRF